MPRCGDHGSEYHTFSLRFRIRQQEEAFLSARAEATAQTILKAGWIASALTAVHLGVSAAVHKRYARSAHQSDSSYEVALLSGGCLTLAICLTLLLLFALRWERFRRPAALELAGNLFGIMVLVTTFCCRREVLASLRGYRIEEVTLDWQRTSSRSNALLVTVYVLTSAHFYLPVRWFTLLPLELLGGLSYPMIVLLHDDHEVKSSMVLNTLLLAAFIATIAAAKRSSEVGERQAFTRLLAERSMRHSAEFRLSQAAAHGPGPDEGQRSEGAVSAPTTAPRSRIFDLYDACAATAGLTSRLEEIGERGDAERWRIRTAEVQMQDEGSVIGKGGFGVVHKATFCRMPVAVKFPLRKLQDSDLRALPELCTEVRVMRHLRHPHIVGLVGVVVEPQRQTLAVVLEFVDGETLKAFMQTIRSDQNSGDDGLLPRYQVLAGVCLALLYLHTRSPHVVHGDLKSGNIMVERCGGSVKPRLLDFGLARVVTRSSRPLGGTTTWMAPEVYCRRGPVSCSADVYSFGRLMAYVATGVLPLAHLSMKRIKRALREGRPPPSEWPEAHAFAGSRCFQRSADACTRASESERPGIDEVHEGLLVVAVELGLTEGPTRFQEELRALVAQSHAMRLRGPSGAPPAPAAEPEPAPPSAGGRLPTLREGEPLGAPAAAPPPAPAEGAPRPRPSWRPFPDVRGTSQAAMARSLVAVILRWNYEVRGQPCCSFHRAIKVARAAVEVMDAQNCHDISPPGGQSSGCPHCGIMGVEGMNACDICGSNLRDDRPHLGMAL